MAFLKPTGPFEIGSINHSLLDTSRPSHLKNNALGRRVTVKAWYPCSRIDGIKTERIWEELRQNNRTPLPMKALLGCLRPRTSTFPFTPLSSKVITSSLVVYNQGLISFPSENTSLMEELASHGYVVMALAHAEQYAELQALNRNQSSEKRKKDAALSKQIERASQAEKAELAVEYYGASTNTNQIVIERARDTSYVLDHANEVLELIPGYKANSINISSANLAGFSIGGAVSTEASLQDQRVKSVVNLDGGMYGTNNGTQTVVPYLMMYSSINAGINDNLLSPHANQLIPPNSNHLNYHDISVLLPFLRYLRITGSTNPTTFIESRNKAVREFIATIEPA